MTVFQAANLIKQFHYKRLSSYDKRFIDDMVDGLGGMGDVKDSDIPDFLNKKQENRIWKLGKRFLISKATKL